VVNFLTSCWPLAAAHANLASTAYLKARDDAKRLAGAEGIDKLVADNKLDALIAPSYGPANRIDVVTGDHDSGYSPSLPAIAGYPHLTVPMGQVQGLPVGLSFIGPAWSEARLLALGYAYEQIARARKPPTYRASVEGDAAIEAAMAPAY
jgi:amidase